MFSYSDALVTALKPSRLFIILGLLAVFISACVRFADRGPLASRTTPAVLARTPEIQPTDTLHPLPTDTATGTTRVPKPTPSPQPTSTPSGTLNPTAILSTLEALRSGTESHLIDSPDGKWQAELISQVCAPVGNESLIYYRLSLRQLSTDETLILVEDLGPCGLGAPSYELTAWSPDSQYLYYTRRVVPDGAALIAPSTIYRLEAASADTTPLPGSGPISPDQAHIAWTDGRALILYDLRSAGLQTYDDLLPAELPTYLVWQPDGRGILFVQTENESYPFGSSTVGLIALDSMAVQVLHAGDNPALIAMQGFEPGGVLIGDDQGRLWFLSIPAGELTQR